jgi:hypothetical protein
LRQSKGQSVQEYTQEFRKRALILGIPLYTQETLFKYIGGLHTYLRHMILMFNPTNLDEVCVQATHIESKGKTVHDVSSAEPVQAKEGKEKWKVKHVATMKKGDERPTCLHCQKQGHEKEKEVSFHYNAPVLVDSVSMVKRHHGSGTISFTCSMFIFSLLLISSTWLGPTMLNEDVIKNVINVLNNVDTMLIVVLLSQMYRFQEEWIGDTGQVRQTCPHLFYE